MIKNNLKRLGVIAGLSLTLIASGCGSDDTANEETTDTDSGDVNYSEELDYTITGIEPGAGVVQASENVVEEYDLDGWDVQTSSSGAMATALGTAIDNEEPIIVTGWSPHWKFAKYDLKYLEDPKEVFGGVETIETMARKGFSDDHPDAAKLLEQFEWTTDDLENVMSKVDDGATPEDASAEWIEENEDKVDTWKDGVEGGSDEIELVYVEWDTEVASTNVIGKVLSDVGYDVTISPLDNAIMWQAVANGDADAMVAAWLPATHGDLYEEYKDDIEELGVNLEGAKIGLVVPTYMDIDSIEDLEAK